MRHFSVPTVQNHFIIYFYLKIKEEVKFGILFIINCTISMVHVLFDGRDGGGIIWWTWKGYTVYWVGAFDLSFSLVF